MLRDELLWLWDARSAIHVHEVDELVLDAYDVAQSNRAISVVTRAVECLRHFVVANEFDDLGDSSWLNTT